MKKLILLALVLFIGAAANQTFAQKETKVVCFKSSMDCDHCEKTLTDHLRFEKGVKDLKVDLATNTIKVEYKEGKNSDEAIAKSIEKKGYKAEKITGKEYQAIVENTENKKE
jgi:copper chaperone CopZ